MNMADPLSVLGAAVGVTSLAIQLAEECVKCMVSIQDCVLAPVSLTAASVPFLCPGRGHACGTVICK